MRAITKTIKLLRSQKNKDIELINALESQNRDKLIEVLINMDSNGVWLDEDSKAEGYEPITAEDATQFIIDLIDTYET